jgi:hypothetical protein
VDNEQLKRLDDEVGRPRRLRDGPLEVAHGSA